MDSKRLSELQKLVDSKKERKGNVAVRAHELCELVKLANSDNVGLLKAAEALAGQPNEEVVVQASDLAELIKAAQLPAKPSGGSSGGSSVGGKESTSPAEK